MTALSSHRSWTTVTHKRKPIGITLPPYCNRRQRGDHGRNYQDRWEGHHKPHPLYNRKQWFQVDGPVSDPPTLHRLHRGGGEIRVNKNPATVCQHCRRIFQVERDCPDQRRTNGSNGWKSLGHGVRIHSYLRAVVILANTKWAAQQTWGAEISVAHRKIVSKYRYNHIHDADSIREVLQILAIADAARYRRKAKAPR